MLLYAFLRVLVERDFFITLNNFCHAFQESFSLSHFDSTLINVLINLMLFLLMMFLKPGCLFLGKYSINFKPSRTFFAPIRRHPKFPLKCLFLFCVLSFKPYILFNITDIFNIWTGLLSFCYFGQ